MLPWVHFGATPFMFTDVFRDFVAGRFETGTATMLESDLVETQPATFADGLPVWFE